MSPRRTRPKRRGRAPSNPEDEGRPLAPDIVVGAPPGWQVRAIQPAKALKTYRCPGCDHEVRPATAHLVAWREGAEDDRRHWHTPCFERGRHTLGR